MRGLVGAVIVLFLLLVGALAMLAIALPEWMNERQRRKCSEEAAERLRQRVREVRAEADAAKDELLKCRETAIDREAEDKKTLDPVDIANAAIAELKSAPKG